MFFGFGKLFYRFLPANFNSHFGGKIYWKHSTTVWKFRVDFNFLFWIRQIFRDPLFVFFPIDLDFKFVGVFRIFRLDELDFRRDFEKRNCILCP